MTLLPEREHIQSLIAYFADRDRPFRSIVTGC